MSCLETASRAGRDLVKNRRCLAENLATKKLSKPKSARQELKKILFATDSLNLVKAFAFEISGTRLESLDVDR